MSACWKEFAYLAVLLDAFSRRVIGWALDTHLRASLATAAAALNSRPRKTLDWKTPAEALDQLLVSANKDCVATTA